MKKHFYTQLATWFGAGYLPKAPGTWGTLFALPFWWAVLYFCPRGTMDIVLILLFIMGTWAAEFYDHTHGGHDNKAIVIDEVVGMGITLLALPQPLSHGWPFWWAIGFCLFRLFDITKPWPVGWIDRRLKGGLGVMADDVAAGIYAQIIFSLLLMTVASL